MPRAKISLLPDSVDLELYSGDGAAIQLAVTDNLDQPILLNGEIAAQIRLDRATEDVAAAFAADINVDEGVVVLSLTGVQTSSLISEGSPFKGVWDVEWTPPATQPITIVQGKVTCDADVTRQ